MPKLGLVCQTLSDECRFRTITRSRLLALPQADRRARLEEIYRDNVRRLSGAFEYCRAHDIPLFRMSSSLFPASDEPLGELVLRSLAPELAAAGDVARRHGLRVVNHPDQFVVLSSERPDVVANSVRILEKHALAFDLMGMPRSPWAAIILHGGKGGRADALVEQIAKLPDSIRSRLCLENDEYAYSAQQILDVCRRAGVPMVFDNHHHAVNAKLKDYDDPSVERYLTAARATWPDPAWQLVHLSNGLDTFLDPRHSHLITAVPAAYRSVPWIEVEAKGKEEAIVALRANWPR